MNTAKKCAANHFKNLSAAPDRLIYAAGSPSCYFGGRNSSILSVHLRARKRARTLYPNFGVLPMASPWVGMHTLLPRHRAPATATMYFGAICLGICYELLDQNISPPSYLTQKTPANSGANSSPQSSWLSGGPPLAKCGV